MKNTRLPSNRIAINKMTKIILNKLKPNPAGRNVTSQPLTITSMTNFKYD